MKSTNNNNNNKAKGWGYNPIDIETFNLDLAIFDKLS